MNERRGTSSTRAAAASIGGVMALTLLFACETVVVSMVEIGAVEIVPHEISLLAGHQETALAVVRDPGGAQVSGLVVTWTIDDAAVATVTSEGVVEARAPGTTWVRASAQGVSGTAEVSVLSGPRIQFSTRTVDLDASPEDPPITTEVEVVNGGNGTLNGLRIEVTDGMGGAVPWLAAELASTSAPTRLRLVASPTGLESGTHEAVVTVDSPVAGSADVRVRLRIIAEDPEPEPKPEPDPGDPEPQPGACEVRDRTFSDDVEIPSNTTCVFTNVRVQGRLDLRRGSRLVAVGLTVDDHVHANDAAALDLTDSQIDGELRFERGGTVAIRTTTIDGKLELKSNLGSITLSDNVVDEDIKVEDNRGGPFTLFRNSAKSIDCQGNDPAPTGAGNVAADRLKAQCAGL
jgi:hypothetical protein